MTRELIVRSFSPRVAVVCSPDVDDIAIERGFPGFVEMLQPFGEKVAGRVSVRDSQGASCGYDDFSVRFVRGNREIGDSADISMVEQSLGQITNSGDVWSVYLSRLLAACPISPHETFSRPVCSVCFVSSRNADALAAFAQLGTSVDSPRCWVLVEETDSGALFDAVQRRYKADVYLLRLPALAPFVRDLVRVGVVPHIEQQLHSLSEQYPRRGVAARLFLNASRRYLSIPPPVADPAESEERLVRRLADCAMMLRDWRFAHSTYESLRKDYSHDGAWKEQAGAQEMAAISLLLQSPSTPLAPVDAMLDAACYSYLARCSAPYFALRTLLIAAELLRCSGSRDAAARWTIRAASLGVVGGLGVALLNENVAQCYSCNTRKRKRALWLVLAGCAWLERDTRGRALRCLDEACTADAALQHWDAASTWISSLQKECADETLS